MCIRDRIYAVGFKDTPDGKRHYATVTIRGRPKTIFKSKSIKAISPFDVDYWSPSSIYFERNEDNLFDRLIEKPKKIFERTQLRFGISDFSQ